MTTQSKIQPGTPVIVRARGAGVHFGTYQGHTGQEVRLTAARRLWYWTAAKSISLSGVAAYGLKHADSRIGAPVEETIITDAVELLTVSEEAATSITEAPIADAA